MKKDQNLCIKFITKTNQCTLVLWKEFSLHTDYQHVAATYVAILRVVRSKTQMYLCVRITPQIKIIEFWSEFPLNGKTVEYKISEVKNSCLEYSSVE